ncbi:transposable element Tcb1 transposase [Trichonephila clavipes]|uniref:Transposable element Tcb1 transposase n=1 Tax=Trichonephila clavipes TaxID=2585209 RepID=A0A8X6REC7_TRICX|nr:transposable element Tcb1 transposase [Trichonephila clavipes]
MDWPAYSLDMNPIERVWDMIGRQIAARQPPSTCLPELLRALLDEWCNIPEDQIDNLIACLGVCCVMVDKKYFKKWTKQNTVLNSKSESYLWMGRLRWKESTWKFVFTHVQKR